MLVGYPPERDVARHAQVLRAEQTARVRIARDELRRIADLSRAIDALENEIAELVAQAAPQLLDEPGCGPLTAAKLAGADRFSSDRERSSDRRWLGRCAGEQVVRGGRRAVDALGIEAAPPPQNRRKASGADLDRLAAEQLAGRSGGRAEIARTTSTRRVCERSDRAMPRPPSVSRPNADYGGTELCA
jgi:hypothetical protein